MAQDLAVRLIITGDATNLQDQLKQVAAQLSKINGGGGSGGMGGMFDGASKGAETFQQSLRGLIGRFSALWAVMKSSEGVANLFNVGIQFNSTIENSRLGIASLITAQAKLSDTSGKQLTTQQALTAAMAMGDDQIQKLRISGLQTAATTEQLVSAYQDAVGGGLRAGMSLDQIRLLTVQTVQAAGAMGVPMNQLNQEIRSILDGTIDRNSRVAIRLGITNADVAKWKDAGTLFSELNKRMEAFSVAGKESMNNWTVLLSNMAEASQILLGDAFKAPMKNIQAALSGVMETIINIDTANISEKIQPVVMMLKDLGNILGDFAVSTIRAISGAIMSMGQWWAANRDALAGVVASFKVFMGDALSFIASVVGGIIRFLADSFLWFTKLPEPIKITSVAIGAFAVALMAVQSQAAIGLATSLGGIVTVVQKLGQVFVYATQFGLPGFAYALTSLVNPVTLVLAGVAALAAGFYYFSTSGERAAKALLETKRQSTEATAALIQLVPTLKSVDDEMKLTNLTTEQAAARDRLRKQAIEDLIKLAPDQEAMIRKEVSEGKALAQVWKDIAAAKIAALQVDIRKQQMVLAEKAKDTQEDRPLTSEEIAGLEAGNMPPDVKWARERQSAKRAELEVDRQRLQITMDELAGLQKKLDTEILSASLKANTVVNEQKLKDLERQRHATVQLLLLAQEASIQAMPKGTMAEREAWEVAKARLQTERQIEQARLLAQKAKIDGSKTMNQIEMDGETKVQEIHDAYTLKKVAAEEAWEAFVRGQEGDTLQRKLANLQKELDARAESLFKATGLIITEDEKRAILAERTMRETVAFREQEMKKLETAMADLERQKGTTFNFGEQKAAIIELADKLNISAEAVQGLTNKFREIAERKSSWFGGFVDGVKEVAQSVTDRFKLMKDAVTSMANGMRSAFSTAIQGMLSGSMNLSQGLKSIWKGITNTIIQAVADIIAKFIVAGIANTILGSILSTTSKVTAASMYQLAVMESWAAYAGMPFIGMPLALAQIAAITASYAAVSAIGMGSGATTATTGGSAGGGLNYGEFATGGLIDRPTLALMGEVPGSRELVAPESTFIDWIKTVGERAMKMPMGGFKDSSGQQLAFAGGGGQHIVQASFDGALIIGDSQEGLRKAAKQLRTIRTYDERANG